MKRLVYVEQVSNGYYVRVSDLDNENVTNSLVFTDVNQVCNFIMGVFK